MYVLLFTTLNTVGRMVGGCVPEVLLHRYGTPRWVGRVCGVRLLPGRPAVPVPGTQVPCCKFCCCPGGGCILFDNPSNQPGAPSHTEALACYDPTICSRCLCQTSACQPSDW